MTGRSADSDLVVVGTTGFQSSCTQWRQDEGEGRAGGARSPFPAARHHEESTRGFLTQTKAEIKPLGAFSALVEFRKEWARDKMGGRSDAAGWETQGAGNGHGGRGRGRKETH